MLGVQALEAEQFSRRHHHLVPEQALEHLTHIDPAQRAHPDRGPAFRLDELQGIAQSLAQQLNHLRLAVLEPAP
ncbi:hypothetical protein D9M73_294240 [compost metagenome]